MNKAIKVGVAALALVAVQSVRAQSEEPVVEESYGWTPVAFGLATPLQLPWGFDKWDVFGFDFNVFYSQAPLMYGWQVGCANSVGREMIGLSTSGLFNWISGDAIGSSITLGLNRTKGTLYGFDAGSVGWHENVVGCDIEVVGTWQQNITGCNIAVLGNVTRQESCGCTIGGVCNIADKAYGCQLAGVYNQAEELHGCQIGLVNYARECPWGFQIGLVNIILDNTVKVLPIVNGYF